MADEERFVVKPNHVIVVNMMPEVFVAHILEATIARATYPAQQLAELGVASIDLKYGVVGTFVDEIGGNDHTVAEQNHTQQKGCYVGLQ